MRYKYTVTDENGKAEEMEAMSWKKMLKSLLLKHPKFNGWVSYLNKKKNLTIKIIEEGKVKYYHYECY